MKTMPAKRRYNSAWLPFDGDDIMLKPRTAVVAAVKTGTAALFIASGMKPCVYTEVTEMKTEVKTKMKTAVNMKCKKPKWRGHECR